MDPWKLTDEEWDALGGLLHTEPREGPGRRPLDNDRAAAEACLYRHYHSHGPTYRCFGWHRLPPSLGVSPNTANRRFRHWTATGAWLRFWDALQALRGRAAAPSLPPGSRTPTRPRRSHRPAGPFPAGDIIAELEWAYRFFNACFFGGSLPAGVAINLEQQTPRRCRGYFCARLWDDGERQLGHIAIHTGILGAGPEAVLAVLLHEMVHLRNHQVGIDDCHGGNQYHNRHFRDVAVLCGLACAERHPAHGYADTELDERGRQTVRDLRPDARVYRWVFRG